MKNGIVDISPQRCLRLLPLFLYAVLLLFCSCHRENDTDRLLAEIEDRMYLNSMYTDSAKILVDSICRSTALSERGEALKNLILSQANTWPNITQDDDSVESLVVDYFMKTGDPKQLMRAQLNRGYIRIHTNELDKAIPDALDALQYASSVNDSLGVAKAELLLANIYRQAYRSDLAIPHREKSVELLRKLGYANNSFFGTQYAIIAWDYHHIGDNEKSINMMDSLLTTGEFTDSATVAFMRNMLMCPYVVTDQLDKAENVFDSIRGYYLENRGLANWYIVIQMFLEKHQTDSAKYYLDILKDNYGEKDGNWYYYEFSHLIEAASGDYEQAYDDLFTARNIMDSRRKMTKSASPEVAERDYWDASLQKEQENASQRKRIISIVLFTGLIILALGMVKYIRLKRIHRMEIEENLFNIRELQKAVARIKTTNTGAADVVKSVIDPLNILSTEYFAYMDCPYDGTSQFLEQIGHEMENLRTEAYLDKIVTIADSIHNGELQQLRESQLKLKPTEVYLLALKLISFSPKSICWFLKIKPATYYTRWKRLRHKLLEESSSIGEKILLKIETL